MGRSQIVRVRPVLRGAVSPNLHTLVRYLMRGTLIGSCGELEFDSYNPFHEAIDTSGPPTALNEECGRSSGVPSPLNFILWYVTS